MAGSTVYQVNKTLGRKAIPYDDGSHVIFVNAAVDDGSAVAKMMQYFVTADPEDMSQGDLSKRVHYLKADNEGEFDTMCEAAEKLLNEGRNEGWKEGRIEEKLTDIRNLMANLELTAEQAMNALNVPEKERAKYLGML